MNALLLRPGFIYKHCIRNQSVNRVIHVDKYILKHPICRVSVAVLKAVVTTAVVPVCTTRK